MFFAGIILLALTFASLYLTGAIYDADKNLHVQSYFFQPDYLSELRPGKPLTAEEIGDSKFFDLLVKKFVTEYFYVIPDSENVARRTLKTRSNSIYMMSSNSVFENWLATEEPLIEKLAEKKAMRIAHVIDEIYKPKDGNYWIVNYELITWETPNDFNVKPTVSRGTLFLQIHFEPGIIPNADMKEIHEYLEEGNDPVTIYNFQVNEVIQR